MEEILEVLPERIRGYLQKCPGPILKRIEEIRLRIHRPLEIIIDGEPYRLQTAVDNPIVTSNDGERLLNRLSDYSVYAIEEELKRGYITIKGGHRVGLAGKVVTAGGVVKLIRDISSFNIRVAKQKIGVAKPLVPFLFQNKWLSTLIIGPPQTGKTTLLRDLARIISLGDDTQGIPSKKVGIVDERSEIAGCIKGIPQNELGPRVDVLDACPKAEGMMMMVRSMSPDVLIVDEIGRKEDSDALLEAINAGVSIIATVHGNDYAELMRRPTIRPLLESSIFSRYLELTRRQKPGQIKRMLDESGKPIYFKTEAWTN